MEQDILTLHKYLFTIVFVLKTILKTMFLDRIAPSLFFSPLLIR